MSEQAKKEWVSKTWVSKQVKNEQGSERKMGKGAENDRAGGKWPCEENTEQAKMKMQAKNERVSEKCVSERKMSERANKNKWAKNDWVKNEGVSENWGKEWKMNERMKN